jgi:hypothetical protein
MSGITFEKRLVGLRSKDFVELVRNALQHSDGVRYAQIARVVMPKCTFPSACTFGSL